MTHRYIFTIFVGVACLILSGCVMRHGPMTARSLKPGMDRLEVMQLWGAPVSCSRAFETSREICLYAQTSTTYMWGSRYRDRDYRSVYYVNDKVVDWQSH